jgi:hypothetical protein
MCKRHAVAAQGGVSLKASEAAGQAWAAGAVKLRRAELPGSHPTADTARTARRG